MLYRQVKFAVFSASSNGYRPSILGTVPATGTPIHLVGVAVAQKQAHHLGRLALTDPGGVQGPRPPRPGPPGGGRRAGASWGQSAQGGRGDEPASGPPLHPRDLFPGSGAFRRQKPKAQNLPLPTRGDA